MLPLRAVCMHLYKMYVDERFIFTSIIILCMNLFVLIPLHKHRFLRLGNVNKGLHVADKIYMLFYKLLGCWERQEIYKHFCLNNLMTWERWAEIIR